MVLGFVVALMSLIHMALREREQQEARELEEIQAGATNEALFEEGEVLPAKRSREQFEKWGMPVVALVMLALQIFGIYYIITNRLNVAYDTLDSWMVEGKYIALFGAALMGLVLFLRGQFASNLSRMEKQRFLQAGSDYVLFGAYLNFLFAAVVAVAFKDAAVDVYVGTGLVVLLGRKRWGQNGRGTGRKAWRETVFPWLDMKATTISMSMARETASASIIRPMMQ